MPTPEHTMVVAALEAQQHQLAVILQQLEHARRDLMPGPSSFWRGPARLAYDAVVHDLGVTVDAGVDAVRSAYIGTRNAIAGMTADAG